MDWSTICILTFYIKQKSSNIYKLIYTNIILNKIISLHCIHITIRDLDNSSISVNISWDCVLCIFVKVFMIYSILSASIYYVYVTQWIVYYVLDGVCFWFYRQHCWQNGTLPSGGELGCVMFSHINMGKQKEGMHLFKVENIIN